VVRDADRGLVCAKAVKVEEMREVPDFKREVPDSKREVPDFKREVPDSKREVPGLQA
jgi:hypothetical protein